MQDNKLLSQEILALYREARSGSDIDFKQWAMQRCRALLPLHSTSWVNGVMGEQGPVILEVTPSGLKPGYFEAFQPLMQRGLDPVGARMFAHPGRSVLTLPDDPFPAEMVAQVLIPFEVHSAVSGMMADSLSGTFSVVCWHRSPDMPLLTPAERTLHEQLLPHWMECLSLHRVGRVTRRLALDDTPGRAHVLVDGTGVIHHAHPSFGEWMRAAFVDWRGARLPEAMLRALQRPERAFDHPDMRASWQEAGDGLWIVRLERRRGALAAPAPQDPAALHAAQREQLLAEERQRIMRELHDGVGSQLVGLLNLVNSNSFDPPQLEESVRQALDEMRMAVDSMHAGELDLATSLANLRYRLQPRLEAAGIQLHWRMAESIGAAPASASDVYQMQRILLEAFTNVLKHARATRVEFSVTSPSDDPDGVEVLLRDDGRGLTADATTRGRGLHNMRHRAQTIGAELVVARSLAAGGTEVRLRWPTRAAA